MHAIALTTRGGPDVLHPVELPDPHAGPDQVRVRVAAVNAADVMLRDDTAVLTTPAPASTTIDTTAPASSSELAGSTTSIPSTTTPPSPEVSSPGPDCVDVAVITVRGTTEPTLVGVVDEGETVIVSGTR